MINDLFLQALGTLCFKLFDFPLHFIDLDEDLYLMRVSFLILLFFLLRIFLIYSLSVNLYGCRLQIYVGLLEFWVPGNTQGKEIYLLLMIL